MPALEARDVTAGYGRNVVVRGCNIELEPGELVAVIGPNGAGKSTVLKALLGFCKVFSGQIRVADEDITRSSTHSRVRRGMGYVPQGRQVFQKLTVRENLRMGGFTIGDRGQVDAKVDEIFALFPRLKERESVAAGRMSGGEQQMLAIGRALMTSPRVLLLDEPSLGLAPQVVEFIMEQILQLKTHGVTMLMVEQNAVVALSVSDRGYVVDQGTTRPSQDAGALLESEEIRELYLGGSRGA